MKNTTVHAAYDIGEGRHVTIFYNDKTNLNMVCNLIKHLQTIPSGRKLRIVKFIELDNNLNPNDPLIGAKLEIMDETGKSPDTHLMNKIGNFSDMNSWRSNLEEKDQYKFTLHTTLGLKSDFKNVTDFENSVSDWNLVTGGKVF